MENEDEMVKVHEDDIVVVYQTQSQIIKQFKRGGTITSYRCTLCDSIPRDKCCILRSCLSST